VFSLFMSIYENLSLYGVMLAVMWLHMLTWRQIWTYIYVVSK